MRARDLTGQRFGRLVALARAPNRGNKTYWLFRCDCGADHTAQTSSVTTRNSQSCGCLHSEIVRVKTGPRGTGHGEGNHGNPAPLYKVWMGMRQRCRNPKHKAFRWYGARGIAVAPEWEDYTTFRDWAKAHGYSAGLTIDRIDPDQGYSPANCRWITKAENSRGARRPGTVGA